MHRFLVILVMVLWTGAPLMAGAWLREPGETFSVLTGTVRGGGGKPVETETGLYIEHGLAPRLTLGFDLNNRAGMSGHALVFVRVPLSKQPGLSRWAFEIGVGAHHYELEWNHMAKATLSYGRALPTRRGYGWVAVDTAIEFRRGSQGPLHKLDAALGIPVSPTLQALLKIETNRGSDRPFVYAITPGVLLGKPSATRWVLGLEHRRATRTTTGLKLELWRTF